MIGLIKFDLAQKNHGNPKRYATIGWTGLRCMRYPDLRRNSGNSTHLAFYPVPVKWLDIFG